jgi:hypothetical protein
MNYKKKIFALVFGGLMLGSGMVLDASAQRTSGASVQKITKRPIVVRRVYYRDPFWRSRHWGYGFYDPFWGPTAYDSRSRKERLQDELAEDRRDLRKNAEKYRKDGVISAKEQKKLNDKQEDIRELHLKLSDYGD